MGAFNGPGGPQDPCNLSLLKKLAGAVDIKPFFGLIGVLIAAMTSEFNDQVTSIALIDVRGALGISHDSGTWIQSLYVSAEIIGMAISPWLLTTLTLRRWTLCAIARCGVCDRCWRCIERADPVQPEHRGDLRSAAAPRARGRPHHPPPDGHGASR